MGSVNTAVPRFATVLSSTGTAMTYADSPTDGATITINTAGIYALRYTVKQRWDSHPGSEVGLLKNVGANPGMTSPNQLAYIYSYESVSTAYPTVHTVVRLQSGDVVHPWGTPATDNEARFEIIRIH